MLRRITFGTFRFRRVTICVLEPPFDFCLLFLLDEMILCRSRAVYRIFIGVGMEEVPAAEVAARSVESSKKKTLTTRVPQQFFPNPKSAPCLNSMVLRDLLYFFPLYSYKILLSETVSINFSQPRSDNKSHSKGAYCVSSQQDAETT